MTDAVHSSHSPIFDSQKSKKLPPSFYWGMLFAVILHLGLLYYFFNQTFSLAPVEAQPPEKPIIVSMEPVKPKPIVPTEQHTKPIALHAPTPITSTTVETLPVPPVTEATPPQTGVPPVLTGPIVTQGPVAVTPVYVTARWARFPDSNALLKYYPPAALDDGLAGSATVECIVLDAAGHVRCTAISEAPGHHGFGKATVQMVQDTGRVDTTQGNVKIGSILRQTVKWSLQD